jgi:hypothetical protein
MWTIIPLLAAIAIAALIDSALIADAVWVAGAALAL